MKTTLFTKLAAGLLLILSTTLITSASFVKTNTYDGSFTDVKQDAWYATDVALAYELGFINGMSDTIFLPQGTVTVAQGITMASRVHAAYNAKTVDENVQGEWYDMYVKYAKENGIIYANQFDSYTRELKRYEMAELFHDAMPTGYYNAINEIDYIPDVPAGETYADKLFTLYNAGILTGSDDYGTFLPHAPIVRSECATIINRVALVENRVRFEILPPFALCDWETSENVEISGGQLNVGKDGTAQKSFQKADGKVCFETYFYSQKGDDFEIAIGDVLTVKSHNKMLVAGEKELYSLTPDMWYRLRVEADVEKGKAKVLLNGIYRDEVKLAKNEPVHTVKLASKGEICFDFVNVYELYEYDDYVPQPEIKASMDDYTVGFCTPLVFEDGTAFYKDGMPETCDWEIKHMVEHGIDFRTFLWYADVSEGAIKHPNNSAHLHDGYKYAKYSNYMKYCILWEAENGKHFNSEQFRQYVVPYWFENYFLDDRYMTTENQLVLPILGAENLYDADYFKSVSGVKAEFDYLEKVARSHGFDGVLFFSCDSSSDTLANMGFDASYTYKDGATSGSFLQANKDRITSSANNTNMYTIPAISTSFDSIIDNNTANDSLTAHDYALAVEWVKNDYLPAYSHLYSWAENLVFVSFCKEVSEGADTNDFVLDVFEYMDVIRQAFTNLAKEHEHTVPTPEQKERINQINP